MNKEIIEGHAQIYAPTVGWHEIKLKDIPGVMFALSQARQSALEEAMACVNDHQNCCVDAAHECRTQTLAAIEGLIKKV